MICRKFVCFANMSEEDWTSKRGVRVWFENKGFDVEPVDDPYVRFKCTKNGFPYVLLVCPVDTSQHSRCGEINMEKWEHGDCRIIPTIWEREDKMVTRVDICSPSRREAVDDALTFYDMTEPEDMDWGDAPYQSPRDNISTCPVCLHLLEHHVYGGHVGIDHLN
eukprot:gb/GECG01004682.1/.p1 GENE.gb/GECG01004682.1/~~gb/GECG01004682.1/.p1  ORF type:complete len:164 (+),score=15.50 gb/GECG01004682.1/:1-492(+)